MTRESENVVHKALPDDVDDDDNDDDDDDGDDDDVRDFRFVCAPAVGGGSVVGRSSLSHIGYAPVLFPIVVL